MPQVGCRPVHGLGLVDVALPDALYPTLGFVIEKGAGTVFAGAVFKFNSITVRGR